MTTLSTLQTQTREPIPTRYTNHSDIMRISEAQAMASEWKRLLLQNGAEPSRADISYATQTFAVWQETRIIDKPVIIAAPPAFGKSTMLSVFLREMVKKDPETFSAIIVKERVDDVRALVEEINAGIVGSRNAYAIRGYDPAIMTREQYNEQFNEFVFYNVVVMTTKQFELQTLKKNLTKFVDYRNSFGRSLPRRLLMIDEKPSLVLNHTLTTRSLNTFISDVQQASRNEKGERASYYAKTLSIVNQLREVLESGEEMPGKKFPPINPRYKVPAQMERDYSRVHGHSQITLLRAFEKVVSSGGIYDIKQAIATITTTQIVHYEYTLFNTFILDGTGSKDPDYISSDFYLSTPAEMPTYENVTFHICDKFNLSKTSLTSQPLALQRVAEVIRTIAEKKEAKTLVVTYKMHADALSELLIGSNTVIKHFDGGRGSNAFVGCDSAVYIGSLFKGTTYYSSTAQAVAGERLGIELDAEYKMNKATGITFNDNLINEYRDIDMAVNMIQETNRLRASRKKQSVDIYIFNKSHAMVTHLVESYPMARLKDFTPIERIVGKETTADALIRYFADMPAGSKVRGSSIKQTLDIHKNTFTKQMQSERVIRAMELYGITKEKTSYIKGA